jgi:hypothetical protein
VADVPDSLVLRRHRDLDGLYRKGIWVRRAVLAVIAVFCLLGLANVFGQDTSTSYATFAGGSLTVTAPTALRGGDLFSADFTIRATRDIAKPVLVLDPGWARGFAINTIEPSPAGEASRDGRLAFTLTPIHAGQSSILFMQFQVNPTTVTWRRLQNVELDDGQTVLVRLHRTLTVYP